MATKAEGTGTADEAYNTTQLIIADCGHLLHSTDFGV